MNLYDQLLAHQIATLKTAAGAGKSVVPYLDKMKAILRKRVSSFDSDKRTAERLTKMLDKLATEMTVPAKDWTNELKEELKSFAKYEKNYQTEAIGDWVDVNMTEPTVNQVIAAANFKPVAIGATKAVELQTLIDSWGPDEVARMVMGVKQGFVEGLTTNQIIKNVVGAGGLSDISLREAKGVAHDSIMHMANSARQEVYRENEDVVIGYRLVVTLDGRTSDICSAWKESKVYRFTDSYQPQPPFHRSCRTTTEPALSEEFDFLDVGATRAAKGADGGTTVAADTTYYGWLKTQPAWFQDERLGKTKGKIFRNSGLTTEEFRKLTVDDLGRPLTLDEMAKQDKQVQKYLQKIEK